MANLIGMDAVFRLERLSGRYRNTQEELSKEHTVYSLGKDVGLDLWTIAREFSWIPVLDAQYGSAAYVPMTDQGKFEVSMTQSGLIIRPLNKSAAHRIKNWQ